MDNATGSDTLELTAELLNGTSTKRRPRYARSFPATTFEEALELALAIQKFAAGQKVRRISLFDHLNRSPDSGTSRQLITSARQYGLITGSYSAEFLELTSDGVSASSSEVVAAEKASARFRLSIAHIKPFSELYHQNLNNRLPATRVLQDFLKEAGYAEAELAECVEAFILNAKFVRILRTIAGAERIIPIEQVIEEDAAGEDAGGPVTHDTSKLIPAISVTANGANHQVSVSRRHDHVNDDWNSACFYVTPIGEAESEVRKHSDLFLHSVVEPALEQLNLKVTRADTIGKPGMINAHIIEHIIRSRMVVADLSFHNPNVFYELALRHACKLPAVHIIRKSDSIPFDIEQTRIIRIDDSSIYTLVPQLEVYRAEVTNQVRRAMQEPDAAENPITTFCPALRVSF